MAHPMARRVASSSAAMQPMASQYSSSVSSPQRLATAS